MIFGNQIISCEHNHFGGPCPKCLEKRVDELEGALKNVQHFVDELLSEREGCPCIDAEEICFTCSLLLAAYEETKKA
jgi:hypothetical protein